MGQPKKLSAKAKTEIKQANKLNDVWKQLRHLKKGVENGTLPKEDCMYGAQVLLAELRQLEPTDDKEAVVDAVTRLMYGVQQAIRWQA